MKKPLTIIAMSSLVGLLAACGQGGHEQGMPSAMDKTANQVSDKAADKVDEMTDKAGEAADQVKDSASKAADQVKNSASDAIDKVKEAMDSTTDSMGNSSN